MSTTPQSGSAQMMAGRYRVERLIARGGMGSVYLAYHVKLNRKVALKILSPSPDHEEGGAFEDRFRLEAETLASLNHANIVTIYDYGRSDDGRFFLALEYVDGPRFTDILRGGTLPVDRTVRLILQVAKALRYAHRRGVVHRDLKPSNLLVHTDDDGEEQVKVVDFGLVKVIEDDQSLTRAGLILGSPHCMAPEQIKGDDIDHRADIYALGVLLFRSVTGRWPFHGDSGTATMIAHINNPIPRFADVNPDLQVPDGFEDVVRCCLSKDRSQRYADVATLMVDLRRVCGLAPAASTMGASVTTSLPPTLPEAPAIVQDSDAPTEPVRRPVRASRPWVLLAVVGALVFAVGAVWIVGAMARWAASGGDPQAEQPGPPAISVDDQQYRPAQIIVETVEQPDQVAGADVAEQPVEPAVPQDVVPQPSAPDSARPAAHKPAVRKPAVRKPALEPAQDVVSDAPAPPPAEATPPEPPAEDAEPPPEGYMGVPDDL